MMWWLWYLWLYYIWEPTIAHYNYTYRITLADIEVTLSIPDSYNGCPVLRSCTGGFGEGSMFQFDVAISFRVVGEHFTTLITGMWTFTCVEVHVILEVWPSSQHSTTQWTLETNTTSRTKYNHRIKWHCRIQGVSWRWGKFCLNIYTWVSRQRTLTAKNFWRVLALKRCLSAFMAQTSMHLTRFFERCLTRQPGWMFFKLKYSKLWMHLLLMYPQVHNWREFSATNIAVEFSALWMAE